MLGDGVIIMVKSSTGKLWTQVAGTWIKVHVSSGHFSINGASNLRIEPETNKTALIKPVIAKKPSLFASSFAVALSNAPSISESEMSRKLANEATVINGTKSGLAKSMPLLAAAERVLKDSERSVRLTPAITEFVPNSISTHPKFEKIMASLNGIFEAKAADNIHKKINVNLSFKHFGNEHGLSSNNDNHGSLSTSSAQFPPLPLAPPPLSTLHLPSFSPALPQRLPDNLLAALTNVPVSNAHKKNIHKIQHLGVDKIKGPENFIAELKAKLNQINKDNK